MIHEVDDALRTLVRRDALNGSDVEVLFDAPTRDWASRRNTPAVDVYLYDIREDMRRRQAGVVEARNEDGTVQSRVPLPRHFKLSYLVTAWTQRPEDEHRLLASVLSCFVRLDSLPADVLTGSLAEMGLAVGVQVALPPPQDRQISDVWSALGGELKAAIDLVVLAPMDTGRVVPFGPPVYVPPRLRVTRADGVVETTGPRRNAPRPERV